MALYDIKVELIGHDGNAFAIMGAVQKALTRAGATPKEQNQYFEEATSGDYNHLLAVTSKWVKIV
jgi:hypothetical protein